MPFGLCCRAGTTGKPVTDGAAGLAAGSRSPRQEPPSAVALRNAPAGAAPPYRAGQTGSKPGTPRGAYPCREAYMPPLRMRGSRTRTKNVTTRQPPTGRMHAAPTMRGKWQTKHKRAAPQGLRRGQDPALQGKANITPTRQPGSRRVVSHRKLHFLAAQPRVHHHFSFLFFHFSFFSRVCSQYSPMLAPGRPVHSSAR